MKSFTAPKEHIDFESLPPTLKRKFFSNVERLRLAQDDRYHDFNYQSNLANVPGPLHHRAFRNRPCTSVAVNSLNKKRAPLKLRKPSSLHVAYLAACADRQYFHTLPPKIQQKLFSKEEQNQFSKSYCDSEILDAADEAFYRLKQGRHTYNLYETLQPVRSTAPTPQSSTLYFDSSDSDDDMDDTLYDSFRWLDEDGDLDLTLDEYHAHVVNSVSTLPSRRKPSFRRTLSYNAANLGRKPSSIMHRRTLHSSQSSTVPSSLANIINQDSTPRPPSSQRPINHGPRTSTSSIDPSAQYYQDPDARLKLRVYLASPQKFDEAIEFGFPALKDQKSTRLERSPAGPKTKTQHFIGTFLEDDDTPAFDENEEKRPNISRLSYVLQDPQYLRSPTCFDSKRQQSQTPTSDTESGQNPGNREMTLKMTLTRPDLRTDSPVASPSAADFLKENKQSSDDIDRLFWEPNLDEQGLMKKMWRKFRGRKG